MVFAVALMLLGGRGELAAQQRPPIHVQLVLDSSSSMIKNDSARLSTLAAMIFSDLAAPNDSLGLISMREPKFVQRELGPISAQRGKIRGAAKSLVFKGGTNCAGPLRLAGEGLAARAKHESSARQFIVFLSDGRCPEDDGEQIRNVAAQIAGRGVRIFAIGMFDNEPGDPAKDLRAMASLSDGEYFKADTPADLPRQFAAILGRIVGSEAQDVQLEAGKETAVSLDGHVLDASLILTSRAPIVLSTAQSPTGETIALPVARSGNVPGVHVAEHGNNRGSYYGVLRMEEPGAGTWKFRAQSTKGLVGLLIQNYGLDPVLELGTGRDAFARGEKIQVKAWLRDKDGSRLVDENFLTKTEFAVTFKDPTGKEERVIMTPADDGVFTCDRKLSTAGDWSVAGRVSMKGGGLNKRTGRKSFEVREPKLVLAEGSRSIDIGEVKAGSTTPAYPLDCTGSFLPGERAQLPLKFAVDGIDVQPTSLTLTATDQTGEVQFAIDGEHAGGPVDAPLTLSLGDSAVTVRVTGKIIPLTFWERWGRLVITLGVALLLLILVIWIIRGFTSPHSFPANARFGWGKDLDRLKKNELPVTEIPGTKRGFYKNARLAIGGPGSFVPAGAQVLVELEAVGSGRVVIRAPHVELLAVNKFDDSKTKPVEGNESPLHGGEIWKAGDLYFRFS